jgi:hypothetical protein
MKTLLDSLMKTDEEAAETFSSYLKFWLDERGINPRQVEELAGRKNAQVSGSKVSSAINGLAADHRMRTLEAISLAIGRPPEEVYLAALGYDPPLSELPEFKESDFAYMWSVYRQLPNGEKKIYKRFVQMLANEIERAANKDHD